MYDVVVFCEIAGLGIDENGNPCPAGCKVTFGKSRVMKAYSELTANINLDMLADLIFAPRGSVTIITPEEYAERYGDDDEEDEGNA